jgi:2-keto-4-pentenoate hydratase/2-oxohepta-3-ene-1,7-dioic acid hydratase in catechol pathway
MSGFKLASYRHRSGPRTGIIVGDKFFDAADTLDDPRYATMPGALAQHGRLSKAVSKWLAATPAARRSGKSLSSVKLLPPVPAPSAIFCAGANYTDHVEEMARVLGIPPEPDPHAAGLKPWHFIKTSGTLVAPGAEVVLPAFSEKVDWEVELVAVIGTPARNVSVELALNYVAGYTIGNDLSARDHVFRPQVPLQSPFRFDWVSQKSWEGSCPIGPWIVPAAEIGDPQRLNLRLLVNGEVRQDSNTSKMVFSTAEQIAQLSTRITLQPGDLILTGTPAGVGMAWKQFIKAGDVVVAEIERIGRLETRFTNT